MEQNTFLTINEQIVHANGILNYSPKHITHSYNRYISDSDPGELVELLQKRSCRIILIAPTGTGKTKFTTEAIKSSSSSHSDDTDLIQILVTPNRIQNLQNEESYGIQAVVGGTKISYSLLTNENGLSVVADKLEDVFSQIPTKDHIVLVIDEAHDILVESIDYRCETVKSLNRIAEQVIERNGTVVYMTATPEPLALFEFDMIVNCVPNKANSMCDLVKSLSYKEIRNVDAIVNTLIELIEAGKRPLVHCNSKSLMGNIATRLEFNYNYNVLTVTSDDKKSHLVDDTESNSKVRKYRNEIFGSIIENSALPGFKQPDSCKRVDCWLVTSMINVGTNIKGVLDVNGNIIEDDSVVPVFICQDKEHTDTNMMVQFFARVRYHVPEYIVIRRESTNLDYDKSPYRELVEVYRFDKARLDEECRRFREAVEFLNNYFDWDDVSLKNVVEAMLEAKSVHGERDDFSRAMSYNSEKRAIELDTTVAWKYMYDRYQRQYYDYPEKMHDRLQHELETPIYTAELNAQLIKDDSDLDEKKLGEYIEQILDALIEDENFVSEEELKMIERSSIYKDYLAAVEAGADKRTAVNIVVHEKKKSVKEFIHKSIKDNLIKSLEPADYEYVEMACTNEFTAKTITPDQIRKTIQIIVSSDYGKYIKNGLKQGLSIECILKNIMKRETVKDVKKWLDEREVRERNQLYKDRMEGKITVLHRFVGKSGLEQLFILTHLYRTNTSGRLKQTTVNPDMISQLQEAINNWDKLNSVKLKDYSVTDVRNIIKKTFYVNKDNPNIKRKKDQPIRIRGLKLPIRGE